MTHDDSSESPDNGLRLPSIAELEAVRWQLDLIPVFTPAERGYCDRDSATRDGSSYGTQPSLPAATSDVRPLRPSAKSSTSGCDMSSQVSHQATDTSGDTTQRKVCRRRGGSKKPRVVRDSMIWTPSSADTKCAICTDFLQDVLRYTNKVLKLRTEERHAHERKAGELSPDKRDTTIGLEIHNPEALQDLINNEKSTIRDWKRFVQHSHEERKRKAGDPSDSQIEHGLCQESEEESRKHNRRRKANTSDAMAITLRSELYWQYLRLHRLRTRLREESSLEGSQGILQSGKSQSVLQRFILGDEDVVSGWTKYLPPENAESDGIPASEDVDMTGTGTEHDHQAAA